MIKLIDYNISEYAAEFNKSKYNSIFSKYDFPVKSNDFFKSELLNLRKEILKN